MHTPFWEVEVRVPYSNFPFTYKYAIRTQEGLILEVGPTCNGAWEGLLCGGDTRCEQRQVVTG